MGLHEDITSCSLISALPPLGYCAWCPFISPKPIPRSLSVLLDIDLMIFLYPSSL